MRLCSYKAITLWAETRNINHSLMDLIHTKKELLVLSLLCQQRCSFTVWRKISFSVSVSLSHKHIHTGLVTCWPYTDKRTPILRGSFKYSKTRSCKGEGGEQIILYRDILYTYTLFLKPKIHIIFSLITVPHITISGFQWCKPYLLEAACQIGVDNYSLYQYILCQTVMSHPQRASHPK